MYLRLAFFVVLNFLEGETIEIMRRILNNQDIRDLMSEYGFRQYEGADKIGINELKISPNNNLISLGCMDGNLYLYYLFEICIYLYHLLKLVCILLMYPFLF